MDGGLIFFAHPWPLCSVFAGVLEDDAFDGSTRTGAAETEPTEETIALGGRVFSVDELSNEAETLGAFFGVFAGFRRTGANASAADHPDVALWDEREGGFNTELQNVMYGVARSRRATSEI